MGGHLKIVDQCTDHFGVIATVHKYRDQTQPMYMAKIVMYIHGQEDKDQTIESCQSVTPIQVCAQLKKVFHKRLISSLGVKSFLEDVCSVVTDDDLKTNIEYKFTAHDF